MEKEHILKRKKDNDSNRWNEGESENQFLKERNEVNIETSIIDEVEKKVQKNEEKKNQNKKVEEEKIEKNNEDNEDEEETIEAEEEKEEKEEELQEN